MALAVARAHAGAIDLLLTDVSMPGMDGPSLARALSVERPGLRVLLATAYGSGELPGDAASLPKPYGLSDLGARIRALLETPRRG